MKKILFISFASLMLVGCASMLFGPYKTEVSIEKDEISSDGNRYIRSSTRYSANNNSTKIKSSPFSLSCHFHKRDSSTTYHLNMGVRTADIPLHVKKGSPVLFKFGDGSVCQSEIVYDAEDEIGDAHVTSYTHSVFYTYDIYPTILYTKELHEGLKKGLKKVRLEVNGDIYDIEPTQDNISQFLLDCYQLMESRLNSAKTFSDGF